MNNIISNQSFVDLLNKFEGLVKKYLESYDRKHNVYELKSICDCVCGRHNEVYSPDQKPHKDDHQKHIEAKTLIDYANSIENEITFLHTQSFDELWQDLNRLKIKGIGPVTVYDTANNMGSTFYNLSPQYVYLHSLNGPLLGAKCYFQCKNIEKVEVIVYPYKKLTCSIQNIPNGCRMDISYFPDLVKKGMDARKIEQFFCDEHGQLENLLKL